MKRGTPRHPKTYALAEALKVPLYAAVGILEMLWHHTAQHTPRGDIGSLPDVAIAEACAFKKPDVLIEALVQTKWLDRHAEHRLIVHDWPQHCEASVQKWLLRNRKEVLPVYGICLDIEQTKSGQCPSSREAMAMAEAKAVVVLEKKDANSLYDLQTVWFEEIWQFSWRKVDKAAALKAYRKKATSREMHEKILAGVKAHAPFYCLRAPEHRPHLSTWINHERYNEPFDDSPPQFQYQGTLPLASGMAERRTKREIARDQFDALLDAREATKQ